jgi:hypothetical protein
VVIIRPCLPAAVNSFNNRISFLVSLTAIVLCFVDRDRAQVTTAGLTNVSKLHYHAVLPHLRETKERRSSDWP